MSEKNEKKLIGKKAKQAIENNIQISKKYIKI